MQNNNNPIIGILGGLGPQAGVDLTSKIIDQTLSKSDQDHISVILISFFMIIMKKLNRIFGVISLISYIAYIISLYV